MSMLLILAAASVAATAASDDLEGVQITATRRAASPFDVAASVMTIPSSVLERHAPRTVADHFRGEPGTYVQQTTPGQGIAIVRGLKGSEVLHLVDGFRLNNAIFRNAPNQYIALVDPWNLERIDVVRGPLSALYGGDAMGGVVHFISRTPKFESDVPQARAKAGAQFTSADSATATQLEGEVGTQRWVAHGGITWQDVGRLRVGGGERLPFTGFRSYSAHGKALLEHESAGTFIAQAQFSEQPETARYDALVPGFGQTRPDFAEQLFKPQRRRFAQLRWIREGFELQGGYQQIVDDRTSRNAGATIRELEQNESVLRGLSAQHGVHVGASHHLTYGAEYYDDTVTSARQRVDLTTGATSSTASRFPDGSQMQWAGVFASDEWEAGDRFVASAGARFTRYRIDVAATPAAPAVRLEPQDFGGNLGVLFRATDTLRLVANVGRGFRPPNIFDLGTFGARGNRFNVPHTGLDPERVLTYDVGAKYESERFQAQGSVFRSFYRDKITQVLTGATDADGRLVVQSRNATRLTIDGIETGARLHIDPSWTVRATATWTRGEEEFEAQTYAADRIPPLFGMLSVRYGADARWDAEAWVQCAARQDELSPRDLVDPRINPSGTAGWTTFNVRAAFELSRRARFALGVENIADRRYREHGSGFDSPGRSLFATVEWRFDAASP